MLSLAQYFTKVKYFGTLYKAHKKAHKFLYKTKTEIRIPEMEKNPGENFTTVEVDPVTGEYYVVLPEWVMSEFGWYEGTEVNMEVDGDSILITECKGD